MNRATKILNTKSINVNTKITNVYQNIKLYAGKELGSSKHGKELSNFSFVQLWAARNCNIILAECITEFLGNHPTKYKKHLEIIG